MPAIFDFLYGEYCRARLDEMRQQLLQVPDTAVPEANCDVSDPNVSDSSLGDDGTAEQYEALHIH